MGTSHVLAGFILLFVSSASVAVPTIQYWQTDSGVQVYFVPTQGLPILDVRLVFDAGSARDGAQNGVSALASRLLKQGAAGFSAQDIAEQLESVGAQLSASTSRDFTSISYRSLTDTEALRTSWAVLKNIVNTPSFPERDFQREKERTLLSIKRREESPGTLAQLMLYQQMYQGHPYAKAIQGEKHTVNALSVSSIKDFYHRYYVAKNLTMVLVGGITRQHAETLVTDLISGLDEGEKASVIPVVTAVQEGKTLHREYPSQQTHILYSMPVLTHNDSDYFALYVGNHILGGSGYSSRILKEIREERGLAYSAYSYFHPMVQKGPFLMGMETRNEKVNEAAQAAQDTLQLFIEKGPSAEELIAAKKNISGGFALKLDSNKKLLGNVVSIVASGAPLDYLNTYLKNIESVTHEQIVDAFQRRVLLNKMTMVTVGSQSSNKQNNGE